VEEVVQETGEGSQVGIAQYRSLGLIGNPFKRVRVREGEGIATSLEIQAGGNRLLAVLDVLADTQEPGLVWVEKSNQRPSFYHRAALIHAEKALINDDDLNILPAYVQLFVARMGRVRSAMNVVAERLSMRAFNQVLVAWVGRIVGEPDQALLEESGAAGEPWERFKEEYAKDPDAAVEDVFGQYHMARRPDELPPIDPRAATQEAEPEETEESPEDDEFYGQIPPAPTAEEQADAEKAAVLEYIALYTREHLSRVVARGLRVYARDGASALAEELKITKAPRKTLRALADLAALRYRKVCLIYDDFDSWTLMDEDLRIKYMASLTEIRLRLGANGIMAFLIETDTAPDLESEFGRGERVMWDFPGVDVFGNEGRVFTEEVLEDWIESATLPGREKISLAESGLKGLLDESGDDLTSFCTAAAAAIDDAAARGLTGLDETSLSEGRSARERAARAEDENESGDEE